MTMLLGGRAAEQLVFGSVTTGASDDLKRVAEIAHAMVYEYAMGTGDRLAARRRPTTPPRRPAGSATRRSARWPTRRSARRCAILDAHRGPLDALAARLLGNEVLERADIDEMMGEVPGRRAAADGRPPSSGSRRPPPRTRSAAE